MTVHAGQINAETAYQELCADFRSLNGFLWQSPVIIMTLNGGLWFSVATFDLTNRGRTVLLLFAAIADVLMIWALIRLRHVMYKFQLRIRQLDGRPGTGRSFQIVGIFSLLLAVAAIGSMIAARDPASYFNKAAVALGAPAMEPPKVSKPLPPTKPVSTGSGRAKTS